MNRLAHDLDIDQAWEEYNSTKKKKKRQLWIFSLPIFLFAIAFFFIHTEIDNTANRSPHDEKSTKKIFVANVANESHLHATHKSYDRPSPNIQSDDVLRNDLSTSPNKVKSSNRPSEKSNTNLSDPLLKKSKVISTTVSESLSSKEILKQSIAQHNETGVMGNQRSQEETNDSNMLLSMAESPRTTEPQDDIGIRRKDPMIDMLVPVKIGIIQSTANTSIDLLEIPDYSSISPIAQTDESSNVNLSFGIEYSNFTRTIEGVDVRYAQRRNSTEQPLESIRFNLTLSKNISKRLYITTGISLGQYRTKIDNRYTTFESILLEDAVVEIIKTANAVREIVGPVSATVVTNKRDILYQRYIDLSIPISLEYRVPFSNKFGMDVSLGMSLAPLSLAKGKVHESYFSVDNYSDLKELSYTPSIHLQGISAISFNWNFDKRHSLFIGGQYRMDLTNRLNSIDGSSDKFNSNGISLGINLHLN